MKYCFLIWAPAQRFRQEILRELRSKFTILGGYKIEWSSKHWEENLTRLYGRERLPAGRSWAKLEEIGGQPFDMVVVDDPEPDFQPYLHNDIVEFGNINVVEAKRRCREITGVRFSVHSSIDDAETRWCLSLLLGPESHAMLSNQVGSTDLEYPKLQRDTTGVPPWRSVAEIFRTFNDLISYAVIKHRAPFPNPRPEQEGEDIDVLCDDVESAVRALNPKRTKVKHDSTICFVEVEAGWIKIQLYDTRKVDMGVDWANDILRNRILDEDGFYRANPSDDLYVILHFGIFREKLYRDDYSAYLSNSKLADLLNRSAGRTELDLNACRQVYRHFLQDRKYRSLLKRFDDAVRVEVGRSGLERGIVQVSAADLEKVFRSKPYWKAARTNFDSFVWKYEAAEGINLAVKLTVFKDASYAAMLCRDHLFLEKLKGRHSPKLVWGGMIQDKYCLIAQWIDGTPLSEYPDLELRRFVSAKGWAWFETKLLGILDLLKSLGIRHRDVTERNILLSADELYLIDFSWAVFEGEENVPVKPKFQNVDDAESVSRVLDTVRRRIDGPETLSKP